MISPNDYTQADFDALPLVVEGESKIVRSLPGHPGLCLIQYKPTIYSFTQNRAGVVEGSAELRMKASAVFLEVLREAGVQHAYQVVGERFILADLVEEPPPIEVIVKAFHSGTSKHRYYGMGSQFPIRSDHPYFAGQTFDPDSGYPMPLVRFDWRNPMWHPEKVAERRQRRFDTIEDEVSSALPSPSGYQSLPEAVYEWPRDLRKTVMLADEVLCDAQADWYINTAEARKTAMAVYQALNDFLGDRDIVMYDLCLFITADGKTVFGEISQDCGRFRHFDLGSLDKDVWRSGGSSASVLEKWQLLLDLIS